MYDSHTNGVYFCNNRSGLATVKRTSDDLILTALTLVGLSWDNCVSIVGHSYDTGNCRI